MGGKATESETYHGRDLAEIITLKIKISQAGKDDKGRREYGEGVVRKGQPGCA